MKKNCDCYRIESKRKYTYHPITGKPIGHDTTIGVCWGTKEMDECKCNGDETKCDFYPEVRTKARKEQKENKINIGEDSLIVTYDCYSSDVATLCIAKKEGDKLRILNIIQGDEALLGYAWLTGNAELKASSKKEILIDDNIFPNGYCKYHQRPLEIHFEGEDRQ